MLCSKKAQNDHLQRISYRTGGCFEHNTSPVQALGWLEKKEEEERKKKINNSEFDCFRLATIEQFLYTPIAAVDWGSLYKLF